MEIFLHVSLILLVAKKAHQNWFCTVPVSCVRNKIYSIFVKMQLLMTLPMQTYKEI